MQKNLYVLIGVPGTGKTTFVRERMLPAMSASTKVVSIDAIRFSMIKSQDEYFENEAAVWAEFIKQIKQSLEENNNTIVDATHINYFSRKKLFHALGDSITDVKIIGIVLLNNLLTCLDRNSKRTGLANVPEKAIRNLYDNFTEPQFSEGFHEIQTYDRGDCISIKTNIRQEKEDLKDFPRTEESERRRQDD